MACSPRLFDLDEWYAALSNTGDPLDPLDRRRLWLRRHSKLLSAHEDDEGAVILAALALSRFAPVDPDSYALTERWRREAEGADYPRIA